MELIRFIFSNVFIFIGTCVLLFFILAIIMNFKPIQITKYYLDGENLKKYINNNTNNNKIPIKKINKQKLFLRLLGGVFY